MSFSGTTPQRLLRHRARSTGGEAALFGAIVICALAVAWGASLSPAVLVLPIALSAIAVFIFSPFVRLTFLVAGGLVALNSSGTLSAPKLAYLAGAAAVIGMSVLDLLGAPAKTWRRYSGMLIGPLLLLTLLLVTLLVCIGESRSSLEWFRDAQAYLLLAAAPVVGISAGGRISHAKLTALMIGVGTFAAVAYAVEWISSRQAAAAGTAGGIGLASAMFIAGTFSYAFACGSARDERRWVLWLIFAALLGGAFVVSGSRSAVILLAAPLGGLPAAFRYRGVGSHVGRLVAIIVLAVAATVVLAIPTVGLGYLESRVSQVTSGSSANIDGSAIERSEETRIALTLFEHHPLLGQGVGIEYNTVRLNGDPRSSFTMDTGLLLLSKFGLAGLAVGIGFMTGMVRAIRRLPDRFPESAALLGLGWIVLADLPFDLGSEDKGLALVLTLLVALFSARSLSHAASGLSLSPT